MGHKVSSSPYFLCPQYVLLLYPPFSPYLFSSVVMIKVKGILQRLNYSQFLHLILKFLTFVLSQDTLEFVGSFVLPARKKKVVP